MTTLTSPQKEAATSTWNIDAAHSTVEFAVKHMMVSTVKGRFKSVERHARTSTKRTRPAPQITAAIDVASVDTGAEQRDEHLRSDDFFNAAQYPQITFRSTNDRAARATTGSWPAT